MKNKGEIYNPLPPPHPLGGELVLAFFYFDFFFSKKIKKKIKTKEKLDLLI